MYNCRKAIQEYEHKIRHKLNALLFLIVSIYRSLLNSTPLSNIRVAYTGVLSKAERNTQGKVDNVEKGNIRLRKREN